MDRPPSIPTGRITPMQQTTPAHPATEPRRGLRGIVKLVYDRFVKYALKFGVVGLVAFGIDVVVFNLLMLGVFGSDTWASTALGASVVSITVSTLFSWVANRYWTFRQRRRRNYALELFEFVAVAAGGALINLTCVWISHYVLGFTSLLADNIAKNVIGLGLATLFRFLMYRFWVYGSHRKDGLQAVASRQAEAGAMALFEDERSATRDAAELDASQQGR
jgi:putative flippase GtrA